MDINLTLLGEILTFAVLVFVTMKYIWPPLTEAMEERQQKIAAGLAASERGQHDMEIAQQKATAILNEAYQKAQTLIDQAQKEMTTLLEDAKITAKKEGDKIITASQVALEKEKLLAKQELQKYLAELTIAATKQLLQEKVDPKLNQNLVDNFIQSILREVKSNKLQE